MYTIELFKTILQSVLQQKTAENIKQHYDYPQISFRSIFAGKGARDREKISETQNPYTKCCWSRA